MSVRVGGWIKAVAVLLVVGVIGLMAWLAALDEELFGDQIVDLPWLQVVDEEGAPRTVDDRGVRIRPGDRVRVATISPDAPPSIRFAIAPDEALRAVRLLIDEDPHAPSIEVLPGRDSEVIIHDGDETRRIPVPRIEPASPFAFSVSLQDGEIQIDGRLAASVPEIVEWRREHPLVSGWISLFVDGAGSRIAEVGSGAARWSGGGTVPLTARVRVGAGRAMTLLLLLLSIVFLRVSLRCAREGRVQVGRAWVALVGPLAIAVLVWLTLLPARPRASPYVDEAAMASPYSHMEPLRLDAANALVVPGSFEDFELSCSVNLREESLLIVRTHAADVDEAAGVSLLLGTDPRMPIGFAREESGRFERFGGVEEPLDFPVPGGPERVLRVRSIAGAYSATLESEDDVSRVELSAASDRGEMAAGSGSIVLLAGRGQVVVRDLEVRPLSPAGRSGLRGELFAAGLRATLVLLLFWTALGLGLSGIKAAAFVTAAGLPLVVAALPSFAPRTAVDAVAPAVLLAVPFCYALAASISCRTAPLWAMIGAPAIGVGLAAMIGADLQVARELRAPQSDVLQGVHAFGGRQVSRGFLHLTHDALRDGNRYLARHLLSGVRVLPRHPDRMRIAILGGAEVDPREEAGASRFAIASRLASRLRNRTNQDGPHEVDVEVVGVGWPGASSAALLAIANELVLDPQGLDADVVVLLIDPLWRAIDPPGSMSGSELDRSANALAAIALAEWRSLAEISQVERQVRAAKLFPRTFAVSYFAVTPAALVEEVRPFSAACAQAAVPLVLVSAAGARDGFTRDDLRAVAHDVNAGWIWVDAEDDGSSRVAADLLTARATGATVEAIAAHLETRFR